MKEKGISHCHSLYIDVQHLESFIESLYCQYKDACGNERELRDPIGVVWSGDAFLSHYRQSIDTSMRDERRSPQSLYWSGDVSI